MKFARSLLLPSRRVSTGPVFIIELSLYFGLGARLITAYNAQGETRHHLTVAADSLPAGGDAIWTLGRERREVLSLPRGPGDQHVHPGSTSACRRPQVLLQENGTHHTCLVLHETSLPPCSPHAPQAIKGQRAPLNRKDQQGRNLPKGRVIHYMILGKTLPLLELQFPSWALKVSSWHRNDRILKVCLF